MRIAEVPNGKRKNTPDTRIWNGLNRSQGATDGEVVDCVGLSTKMWPAMSAADGRTRIGEWENATDVYETDGHLIVIDDNKLYYKAANAEEAVFLSNVSNQKKQFAEIGRKLVIWPDKIYINLNTGELGSLGAEINGKGEIKTGGQLQLIATPGASSTTGSITLDDVFGGEALWGENFQNWYPYYGAYMKLYTNLSYASGWVYDGEPKIYLPTIEGNVGDSFVPTSMNYFIGSVPETKRYQDGYGWTADSNYYGKITKVTITKRETKYSDRFVDWDDNGILDVVEVKSYERYSYRYDYEVYERTDLDLTKIFEPGDIVSVSGHALLYNNQDSVKINSVSRYNLKVNAAFVGKANYYNVTNELQAGTYRIVLYSNGSGTNFVTSRTIRVGEQLFVITNKGDSGLTHTGVYAYDPQTKVLEAFPTGEESSATPLDAKNNVYDASQDNPMTIERKVPEMAYICERDNRLYGVSNAEESKIFNTLTGQYETVTSRVLHASELGQPTRWNTSNGTAADSWAVAVAGEGDFTGIVSYSGSVIAFKENRMYKLTGDYPAEFYLRSYTVDGVKEGCHKSLAIINEVLYYLSPYGVMSYSGGVPSLISYNLDLLRFQDAVGGRDRTRYYISMEDAKNGYVLYSYDTVRGIWVIESKEQATGIERVGDYAYACIGGKIYKLGDEASTETKEWMALLPETDEGAFEKKRYQYMALIADVDGVLRVYARQNDHEEWQVLGTITEKGKKIHRLPMDTIRCDRIQFKLEGEGKATIWAMERQFTVGSER